MSKKRGYLRSFRSSLAAVKAGYLYFLSGRVMRRKIFILPNINFSSPRIVRVTSFGQSHLLEELFKAQGLLASMGALEIMEFYAESTGEEVPMLNHLKTKLTSSATSIAKAEEILNSLVERRPIFAEAWLEKGILAYDTGRVAESLYFLDNVFCSLPHLIVQDYKVFGVYSRAAILKARIYFDKGEMAAAKLACELSAKMGNVSECYAIKAAIARRTGDFSSFFDDMLAARGSVRREYPLSAQSFRLDI